MVADPRLNEIEAFLRRHLEAEAALSIAALGEPDDDTYLGIEQQANAFYAGPLGPLESRWARPGGTSPAATIDVRDSVHPAALYAIGSIGPDTWIALVGNRRNAAGFSIAEALLVRSTPKGLRITGRASVDPFSEGITCEPSGGEPVDLEQIDHVTILREPQEREHAEFVRSWGRP